MSRFIVMVRTLAAVVCAMVLLQSQASSQEARSPARPPVLSADHLRMQPEEMPAGGLVYGDPSKPGLYVQRVRFTPGYRSRPHFHDRDRWVTVLKGTWWTADGDRTEPDQMVPISAGGVMFHPAGFHHYDGAKGDEVIVQIVGIGPVKTVDVDAR